MRPKACCTSLTLALIAVLLLGAATPQPKKRVLVVHSYHEGQIGHVDEMLKGVESALERANVQIEHFYMDTKRRTDEEWKKHAGQVALQRTVDYKPDVVITLDDNAQKYFAMQYVAQPDAVPLVFSGVNADPKDYGFPTPKVTGVIERPNIVESIELLQRICPDVRRVVLVSDNTPTTAGCYAYAKTLDLPATIVAYEHAETFDDFKRIIHKYENDVDAFGFYVVRAVRVKADDDARVPEAELIEWVTANSKRPTFGLFDTAAKAGLMCGVSVSMREQGFAAGRIVEQILAGESPRDIEVKPTNNGRIMLNLKTAERLGVRIRFGIIKNAKEVIR